MYKLKAKIACVRDTTPTTTTTITTRKTAENIRRMSDDYDNVCIYNPGTIVCEYIHM